MFDKMKELMEMKRQADKIKRELDAMTIESSDVRGIKIVINGSQVIQSLAIEEGLIDQANIKRLEEDLKRAINAAIHKSQTIVAQKMRHVLPGFPGL